MSDTNKAQSIIKRLLTETAALKQQSELLDNWAGGIPGHFDKLHVDAIREPMRACIDHLANAKQALAALDDLLGE